MPWRYLEPGETTKADDQVSWDDNPIWETILCGGKLVPSPNNYGNPIYRRWVEDKKKGEAIKLESCNDVGLLREAVEFLWGLLDDIDATDDAARGNHRAFRDRTRVLVSNRHDLVTSRDGYTLEIVAKVRGETE